MPQKRTHFGLEAPEGSPRETAPKLKYFSPREQQISLIWRTALTIFFLVSLSLPQPAPHRPVPPVDGTQAISQPVSSPAMPAAANPIEPFTDRAPFILLPATTSLETEGQWVHVSDLAHTWATTGWTAVADSGLPVKDLNFREHQMSLQGKTYDKGLGTYPFSEIEFTLDRRYSLFSADIGVDDEAGSENGTVVFHIFLDQVGVYSSDVLKAGQGPTQVTISIAGASILRLVVTSAGDGPIGDFADWADAKLLLPDLPVPQEEIDRNLSLLDQVRQQRIADRVLDRQHLAYASEAEREILDRATAGQGSTYGEGITARFDRSANSLILANQFIGIDFGYGGIRHGSLSLFDFRTNRLVLKDAIATITTDGRTINLHEETRPPILGGYFFGTADEIGLGPGRKLELRVLGRGNEQVTVVFSLYEQSPVFTFQIILGGTLAPAKTTTYRFLEQETGGVLSLGSGSMRYLTDQSRLRLGRIFDDGFRRQEHVGLGKPLFVWDDQDPTGLILALLDPPSSASRVSFELPPGKVAAAVGYSVQMVSNGGIGSGTERSPRLYLELTPTSDTRTAFDRYKTVSRTLYPPMPMPAWVRYQWLSWYVYYMNINEQVLRDQIDYIAANLQDLGPWHIIVDAGWYVAEGRNGSDWRNVDTEKFPSGMADLVSYAHAKGVKVVLYFSAPYLNDRRATGNWLGLSGIIEQHPDWLIPYSNVGGVRSYVYDFDNPAFREYLDSVMTDYFAKYNVDGIKIDGLGNAEGEIMAIIERDIFGEANKMEQPTLPVYQYVYEKAGAIKRDVYIESGWSTPQFAQSYANTFRYGDEQSSFDFPYPFPGLRQHIDYAIFQKSMLGQNANMGAIRGHPDEDSLGIWWLGAALALGTQVSLSFDFTTMSTEALSEYRALLSHYEPFTGETYFGDNLLSDSFATTRNGVTYLGIVNRGEDVKYYSLPLSTFGLDENTNYVAFDMWNNIYRQINGTLWTALNAYEFRLFILRSTPGLVWTNSAATVDTTSNRMVVQVSGPDSLAGFAQIYAPGLVRVMLDDISLSPREWAEGPGEYDYDFNTSMLTIHYEHDQPHWIEIEFGYGFGQ